MKVKRESYIEAELVRRVLAAGGVCEKVTVIGTRGFYDRLVVLPGNRVFFVECKRPQGGRLSPHQMQRHARYRALGAAVALVLNTADIDRLINAKGRDAGDVAALHVNPSPPLETGR